uniref:uncharacterized protein LOC122581903 n=1 Tax=Erigeron canadensis TaxID=72917 RepID=UPI001CB96C95|nr:uncharacterized protein LOC122581903 [Erigeron canadensis]
MEHQQQESSSNLQLVTVTDNYNNNNNFNNEPAVPPEEIRVSKFDYSIDNHFKYIDQISILSGESEMQYQETELQRLNSSVTFLRKWRDFCYQPRTIRFAFENETSQEKDVTAGLNLPQFSSAAVPKDMSDGNRMSSPLSKDFVMYVGGHVWALDWCPRAHPSSNSDTNVEFIAVSAHPPNSAYHKIGAPLTGRGLIQIWCILNIGVKDQDVIPSGKGKLKFTSKNNDNQPKRPRGRPRKNPVGESMSDMDGTEETGKSSKSCKPQKPRGRPRKNLVSESVSNLDGSNQSIQSLAVQEPENPKLFQLVATEENDKSFGSVKPKKPKGRPRKKPASEFVSTIDGSNQLIQSLPVQDPQNPNLLQLVTMEEIDKSFSSVKPEKSKGRPRKNTVSESVSNVDGRDQYIQNQALQDPVNPNLLQLVATEDTDKSFSSVKLKGPKGRSRKKPVSEFVSNVDGRDQYIQNLADQPPESSSTLLKLLHKEETSKSSKSSKRQNPRKKPRNNPASESVSGGQFPQGLFVESPEDSDHLLQVVAIEETDAYLKSCKRQKTKLKPRKKQAKESLNNSNGIDKQMCSFPECPDSSPKASVQPLAVEFPEDVYTRKRKCDNKEFPTKSMRTSSKSSLTKCQPGIKSQVTGSDLPLPTQSCGSPIQQDPILSEPAHDSGFVSEDASLPRLVMGLAHGGKVAWDLKWRPSNSRIISKHLMGYLAVLLGNGALEVFEVPLPYITKEMFSSAQKEGSDPRFIKLKPVFMCTNLKCGDRQSIPLTLEWSTSAPHDLILAGCHDGVVALWKFSDNDPSKDTRPLLCFSADTAPIRALKWAPLASDAESANIIATGGHKGLKFWDIRDPFHPLWDIPAQQNINSMDWLSNPSCVVLSFDDGEIRTISLLKAACDIPVTGMPCIKTPQHGLHSYYSSLSSVWSTQVSTTGMVAYCCSDGKVLHFQLTTKEVEKDDIRNRKSHYLSGSITWEESTLSIFSPVPNKLGDIPRSKRGFISKSNQEKRAKDQILKSQTPEKQLGHYLVSEAKSGIYQKSGDTSQTTETSQALVCADNDNKSEGETVGKHMDNEKEREVLPPKIVAMHCVRWNMNKGSERLLCYGGAAGIVRCQKIS